MILIFNNIITKNFGNKNDEHFKKIKVRDDNI